MAFHIVGVVGQAGHGKDTVANIICEKFGFKRLALADPLKEDLRNWFSDFEEFTTENQNSRGRHPIVRRLQQIYGTEIKRAQDDQYWLKEFSFGALGMAAEGKVPGVVVPDIRFPNEAAVLREVWNGKLFFVERDHEEDGVDMSHDSERYVKCMKVHSDMVFINNGTMSDLVSNVVKSCSVIFSDKTRESEWPSRLTLW